LVLFPVGAAEGKGTCSRRWSVCQLFPCAGWTTMLELLHRFSCSSTLGCLMTACLIRLAAYALGCTSTRSICMIPPYISCIACQQDHVFLRSIEHVLSRAPATYHVLSSQGLCFSNEPFTPPSVSAPMNAKENTNHTSVPTQHGSNESFLTSGRSYVS